MDISADLAADLATLNGGLDDPDTDLEALLGALATSLPNAIASYQGMSMTFALDSHEVSFSVRDGPSSEAAVAASLLIPLSALSSAGAGSSLVLYATTPGAFVDLAADLSYALDLDAASLILDEHRTMPEDSAGAGMLGLRAHTAINQAIGVLIERGHTPESAYQELRRRADLDGGDVPAAAEQLLRGITGPAPAPDDHR